MLTLEEKKEKLPYVVHQTKYLKFVLVKFKPKTNVYAVISINHDDELGRIEWFPRWRQYCFMPLGMTVWNTNCLDDIQKFLNTIMASRTSTPKIIAVICKDMQDFFDWSRQKRHKRPLSITIRKYRIGTTTYMGVSKLDHCRGYKINEIIVTDQAHLNSNYHTLIQDIQYCLKK